MDHPFFAVTDENGEFSISGLPAGSYTLAVWHERLGTQTQHVRVDGIKPVATTFTLQIR
jgi:hypothetical protein